MTAKIIFAIIAGTLAIIGMALSLISLSLRDPNGKASLWLKKRYERRDQRRK